MHLRLFYLSPPGRAADLLSQLELVISLRHVSVCARVDKTNGRVADLRHRFATFSPKDPRKPSKALPRRKRVKRRKPNANKSPKPVFIAPRPAPRSLIVDVAYLGYDSDTIDKPRI